MPKSVSHTTHCCRTRGYAAGTDASADGGTTNAQADESSSGSNAALLGGIGAALVVLASLVVVVVARSRHKGKRGSRVPVSISHPDMPSFTAMAPNRLSVASLRDTHSSDVLPTDPDLAPHAVACTNDGGMWKQNPVYRSTRIKPEFDLIGLANSTLLTSRDDYDQYITLKRSQEAAQTESTPAMHDPPLAPTPHPPHPDATGADEAMDGISVDTVAPDVDDTSIDALPSDSDSNSGSVEMLESAAVVAPLTMAVSLGAPSPEPRVAFALPTALSAPAPPRKLDFDSPELGISAS